MPSYALGFMGATRRLQHIADPSWQPYLDVAMVGALVILAGIVLTVVQLVYSIRTRDRRRDITGDPWDGRTLEWLTLSPPPHYNFAVLPDVHGEEAYWTRKQTAIERTADRGAQLPADRNAGEHADRRDRAPSSPRSAASRVIWYIWWLAILGLIGAFAVFVWYAWRDEHEHIIPVEEVRGRTHASGGASGWSSSTI